MSRSRLAYATESLATKIAAFEADTGFRINDDHLTIPDDMTFRDWAENLGREGLKVDGHPFTLADRPSLRFVYDLIPSTPAAAADMTIILMKGAQMGLTIWEMLADIYMAVKFEPCAIGMYVPDRQLAAYKSSHRFMPVLRTVPAAYERLVTDPNPEERSKRTKGEGNVMTRVLRDSKLLFLWTSGKVATESYPLDVVSFDEVQEMMIADVEKTRERMSASRVRLTLMLSTAKWPDADIHYWYKLGSQYRFHTRCACDEGVVLDSVFPQCIQFNEGQIRGAPADDYVYVCPKCATYIPDPQAGEWRADNPDASMISVHLPQTLSPTISAREMIESYYNAQDLQNFHNRKLGKPWQDPSQIPVTLEILNECARAGKAAGVEWLTRASGCYMGIDQMGAFNVAIIKRRLPDGRQATVHVEAIYDDDPFVRCDVLMALYGIAVCVVETLPNYNDAKRFAKRHKGRVFLAGYADIADNMMRWGDAVVTKADRKTDESQRDRYTVTLDQYKCMQTSMARFVRGHCLFPDPDALAQDIVEKGQRKRVALLREVVFYHFTHTALVVEQDKEQKKFRRKVVKVGIDPHFSYANMLCDVAWARAHGTAGFIIPDAPTDATRADKVERRMPGLPDQVVQMIDDLPAGVCGRCQAFNAESGRCEERQFSVRPNDPACPIYQPRE